jgi:hypothetical protein
MFNLFSKEIEMGYLFSWKVLRSTGEAAFEGVFFAAATVFVLGVTFAMFL